MVIKSGVIRVLTDQGFRVTEAMHAGADDMYL